MTAALAILILIFLAWYKTGQLTARYELRTDSGQTPDSGRHRQPSAAADRSLTIAEIPAIWAHAPHPAAGSYRDDTRLSQ